MLVTAPASTPVSVRERKALCLASSRTTLSSEQRPQKLAPSKRDESPGRGGGGDRDKTVRKGAFREGKRTDRSKVDQMEIKAQKVKKKVLTDVY